MNKMEKATINEQIAHVKKQEKTDMNKSILSSLEALKVKMDQSKDFHVAVMSKEMYKQFVEFLQEKI